MKFSCVKGVGTLAERIKIMEQDNISDCHSDKHKYTVGLLTVSDSCFCQKKRDESGDHLFDLLCKGEMFPAKKNIPRMIVSDEKKLIEEALIYWTDISHLDVIFTIGGTGFSPRDVTPEATKAVCEREAPGLAANVICMCSKDSPFSLLSRATCGLRGQTIILNLPGSVRGSLECFQKVARILPHAIDQLKEDHDKVSEAHLKMQCDLDKGSLKSKVVLSVAKRFRESPYPLISVHEALNIVLEESTLLGTELKPLSDCLNHVLAADVKSLLCSPPYPASIKDGYAVYASEKKGLRVVQGSLIAGDRPNSNALSAGKCMRVSTGSPIPYGADAVVQVEDTSLVLVDEENDEELQIFIQVDPEIGENIRKTGSDIMEGQIVLSKFKCITPFDAGLLSSSGHVDVLVYNAPTVAVLSTGDELVKPSSILPPGSIVDSNKICLEMMIHQVNLKTFDAGIARDFPDDLKSHLELAFANSDVVIVTGGVSMGERDYLKQVLEVDFFANIVFARVFMKPGKPTTFATLVFNSKKKLVFGLPGNPVSAIVTFHLFVVPCLRKMMGHLYPKQMIVNTKIQHELKLDPRPEYHRSIISWDPSEMAFVARSTGNQLSSRLLSMENSNALMILPPATKTNFILEKGSSVEALLFNVFPVTGADDFPVP